MMDERPKLAPKARIRTDPLTGAPLLLFPEGVLELNKTGAAILTLCDGRTPTSAIAQILAKRFDVEQTQAVEDVISFLGDLRSRHLLIGVPLGPRTPTQASSSGGDGGGDPFGLRPMGLLAELTYRCPLHCPYCSNPTGLSAGVELGTNEWVRILREAADLGVLHVHFSGGEPLLRPDLPVLVRTAAAAGLYTNLLTSGIPLKPRVAEELRAAGLDHVQLSLQADSVDTADRLAGAIVHADKLAAARLVRALGWPLTINVVLHRENIGRVLELVAIAEHLGADRLELAHVQFHGWGHENRTHLMPDREALAQADRQVEAARARLSGRLEILYVLSDLMTDRPRACMAGWGRRYLTVNPLGDVLPCPTAGCIPSLRFENVRRVPLRRIWEESAAFNRFRGTQWMPEPCRGCDRREIDFGGCRCRAFLLTGDAEQTDPTCALAPRREQPAPTVPAAPDWRARRNPEPTGPGIVSAKELPLVAPNRPAHSY